MTDRMTPEQRHRCMSRVRSKGTRPEMLVRRWLWRQGYRYRLHDRRLPGTPDIVLRRLRTVVLVNGCFWHGHEECKAGQRRPETRREWWETKIERNRYRDRRNRELLEWMGWNVITIWECELTPARRDDTLQALTAQLSHILLDTYTKPAPKSYTLPETPSLAAAEPTALETK